MDEGYAHRYQDLYENHWWWRAREEFLLRKLQTFVPPGGFERILDVGCGNGLFFDELRQFGEPEGVEPNADLVTDSGRSRGRIYTCPFDVAFKPKTQYGLILMLDVLEHLVDPDAAVSHAASLLKKSGLLIVTVPAFNCLWTAHDDFNNHLIRYRKGPLFEVVKPSGLETVVCAYYCHWLFPLKLLVRLAESLPLLQRRKMASVPGKAMNFTMLAFCRAEQKILERAPPPFGSSLFGAFRSTQRQAATAGAP